MKLRTLNLLAFIVTGCLSALTITIPFIAEELHLSLGQSGFLNSIGNVAKILLVLPVLFISNKFSNRKLIFISVGTICLGFAMVGIAESYTSLLIIVSIMSAGIGLFQPLAKAEVARAAMNGKKGAIVSTYSTIAQIGRFSFSTLIGYLIIIIGWRYSAAIFGLVPLFFLGYVIFKERNKYIEPHLEEKSVKFKLNRKIIVALIASMADSIASSSLILFIPFLIISKNFDIVWIPTLNALILVGAIVGKYFIGRLTDNKPEGIVFIICELIMAVFTLILALNENIFVLIVVSFLLGIVTKGTAPVTQIMVGNTVVHKNHYKHAFSLDAFVSNVGTLMASVGFGLIGDMLGIQSVFIGFTITAVIAAILGGLYHQQMKNLDNPIVR